jgi:DNA modification methylase
MGPFPLTIADPPYGRIVSESWDQETTLNDLLQWSSAIAHITIDGGAFYYFGGYGKPRDRLFFAWLATVENLQPWEIAMPICWGKRRAYGVQHNYLSTREEIAYCIKGKSDKPRTFNVPYLDEKRGYAGYNAKYPAKSEYKRRTAVWTDVTEILKGKRHPCEKPKRLIEIMIETSSNPGDIVFDPFAGSGITAETARALGRYFVLIEQDPEYYRQIIERLS